MAQRLVRKICANCKTTASSPIAHEELLRLAEVEAEPSVAFYKGPGYEKCNMTGYRSRIAIIEVMPMSAKLAELINRRATAQELNEEARCEGMRTLWISCFFPLCTTRTSYNPISC